MTSQNLFVKCVLRYAASRAICASAAPAATCFQVLPTSGFQLRTSMRCLPGSRVSAISLAVGKSWEPEW